MNGLDNARHRVGSHQMLIEWVEDVFREARQGRGPEMGHGSTFKKLMSYCCYSDGLELEGEKSEQKQILWATGGWGRVSNRLSCCKDGINEESPSRGLIRGCTVRALPAVYTCHHTL